MHYCFIVNCGATLFVLSVSCDASLLCGVNVCLVFFFFKQKTAYEMRISDWSSDVCSSDLLFQEALAFNTFWYPQIYVQTALYFKVVEGIDWADVDHRIVMGSRYSALGPWRTSVGARVARIPNLLPKASDANCGA